MPVAFEDLVCEDQQVGNPFAARLHGRPQFKIFKSIVEGVAIPVVDVLPYQERPSEMFRHDKSVLGDMTFLIGIGVTRGVDHSPDTAVVRAALEIIRPGRTVPVRNPLFTSPRRSDFSLPGRTGFSVDAKSPFMHRAESAVLNGFLAPFNGADTISFPLRLSVVNCAEGVKGALVSAGPSVRTLDMCGPIAVCN